MTEEERKDAPDPGADESAETEGNDPETDDTEGQALTWKVRKPIAEATEDAEGHSVRPSPEQIGLTVPALVEDEDAEGHSGVTGSPRPPVD
jgi:hypothetical protein